jgi:trk system potassium uptake protein TrkH
MDWFDAVAHSFATMALGGFSTHTASLGYFNNAGVELVAGLFSLVAGINFGLLYLGWYRRSMRPLTRDPELRFYLGVLASLVLLVSLWLFFSGTFPLREALYHSFFQVISIVTDNGLVSANYANWPTPIVLLLIIGSFFGGCVGSTCGGIKAVRFLLLAKQSVHEIRFLVHPHGRFPIKLGTRPVPDRALNAVWGFFFLYVATFCCLVLAVVATGVDIDSSFGAVVACINNMGVGYGITATYFGHLNETAKWLLVLAMLLGRLELFPPIMLLTAIYWRH